MITKQLLKINIVIEIFILYFYQIKKLCASHLSHVQIKFIHSFIHLFQKYGLSFKYVLGRTRQWG